jgi:outer membrane protein W
MKRNYFTMLLMVLVTGVFTNNLNAQGTYVNINIGYGLKMSSQNMPDYNMSNLTIDSTSSTMKQINLSLGQGLTAQVAFGYMFTKNIGVEMGLSYLLGAKIKATSVYGAGIISDYFLSAQMFRLNPSVIIACGFNKIDPYAKLGVIIGFGSIKNEQDNYETGSTEVMKTTLNGGVAFGLNASAGVLFKLTKLVSLFGEINIINLSWAPTKGKMTEDNLNGTDLLPNMTTSQKKIDFVKSYTNDSKNPRSDSDPRQELAEKFPFGSVGLNVGVRFSL